MIDFSGVDIDHAAYGPRLIIGHDLSADGDNDIQDRQRHGTSIASIIAGREIEGVFGGGVAPGVNVISVQILTNQAGATYASDIERALSWVIQNAETFNIAAVNFSIGPRVETDNLTANWPIGMRFWPQTVIRTQQMNLLSSPASASP